MKTDEAVHKRMRQIPVPIEPLQILLDKSIEFTVCWEYLDHKRAIMVLGLRREVGTSSSSTREKRRSKRDVLFVEE